MIDNKNIKGPPRFSIVSRCVIGHIHIDTISEYDTTELPSSMIAQVTPFPYAMSFSGGALKALYVCNTFFENNARHVGIVIKNYL